jgi:putative acetyltransferase
MTETIRPFRPGDATATHGVFLRAVREGATSRYSAEELALWLPDPAMPADWGNRLARHITLVAEGTEGITGFLSLAEDGYLNLLYVLPERMGRGTADALHAALLAKAQTRQMPRLTVLASRFAQGFLARHGWHLAPDLPPRPRQDTRQGPGENPIHRPMALSLPPRA